MKKTLLCLIAMATTGLVANAQITLNEGDFPDTGDMITYHETYEGGNLSLTDSVSIGIGTANEIYDFRKMATIGNHDTTVYDFVSASASGHAASHPNANLAYIANMDMKGADTIFVRWVFMEVNGGSANAIGVTLEVDSAAVFNGNPPKGRQVILHADYDNAEVWANSSFAVPYSVNSTSHFTVSLVSIGTKHDETIYRNQNVNGYGKLIHPNFPNDSMEVLRVQQRYEHWERDTVLGVEDGSSRDTTYMVQYWAKGYGMPVVIAITESDYTTVTGVFINDVAALPVSVARINPAEFDLYPNPASDVVNIEFEKVLDQDYTLNVYNNLGQVVATQQVSTGSTNAKLEVSNLPQGTYYVSLQNANGEKTLTQKLAVY